MDEPHLLCIALFSSLFVDVFLLCVFLHCMVFLPSPLPLIRPRIFALVTLAVVHCMVFGGFRICKSGNSEQSNSASELGKKESNKGIVQEDINKTTKAKVKGKKRFGGNTSVASRLVILWVDVCTPRVVKNSLDANTPLNVTVQHLAD